MRIRHCWAGLMLSFITGSALAQTPLPERLGYVNDIAGAMSAEAAGQLGAVLSGYASASGIHIAVVALENPVEESPETLAGRALENFLQDDPTQPGALLLWTENGHVVVYVGESLRDRITDAEAQAVIDQWVIPAAASGNVDQALTLGAYQLIAAVNADPGVIDEALDPAYAAPVDVVTEPFAAADPLAAPQQAALALQQDLQAIAAAFRAEPGAAVSSVLDSAAAQARALPDALSAQLPHLAARPDAIIWTAIVVGALLFALNAVWRVTHSAPTLLCAFLMALAVVAWLPTRFTELSLLLLLAAPLALVGWLIRGRAAAAAARAPQATQQDAYAAWLVQQQARQAGARAAASPAAVPVAAAPGTRKPMIESATVGAQSPSLRRMSDLLERAHAAGTATPAFDRLVARSRTIMSAEYKARRTAMVVMLIVLGLFFLPLALLAVGGWVFAEISALKQPNQTLSGFFRQLSHEAQALQRFQGRR